MAESNESILVWAASALANRAKEVGRAFKEDMTQETGPAIAREAVNDLRGTLHQIFFSGQSEGNGEPGTPMSPLQSEVADRKRGGDGVYGKAARLPSPSEVARETSPYRSGDGRHNAQQAAVEPGGWVDRLIEERKKSNEGNDDATGQNERAKGRSLPDEQREQDKGRGR